MTESTNFKDKWTKGYALKWLAQMEKGEDNIPPRFVFPNPALMDDKGFLEKYLEYWERSDDEYIYFLDAVSERLRDNESFVVKYLSHYRATEDSFQQISERLKNSHEFALQLASECPYSHKFFPQFKEEFKSDPEILLAISRWEQDDFLKKPEDSPFSGRKYLEKFFDFSQMIGKSYYDAYGKIIKGLEQKNKPKP